MPIRAKVITPFEQRNGTDEITGEPIVKKLVKDQELIGPEAEFMLNRHPEKLEVLEGKFVKPKVKTPDKVLEEEKKKEEALRKKAEDLKEANDSKMDIVEGRKKRSKK